MKRKDHEIFKSGQLVQVINEENKLYGRKVQVVRYNGTTKKYLVAVQLEGDSYRYQVEIDRYDIVGVLLPSREKEIREGQLKQMIDLALSLNDEEWFNELTEKKKEFKKVSE
jgi:uncharacterized protein YpiB (UPF0302 family)